MFLLPKNQQSRRLLLFLNSQQEIFLHFFLSSVSFQVLNKTKFKIKILIDKNYGFTEIQAKIIISTGLPILFSILFSVKTIFKRRLNIFLFFYYFVVSYFVFQQDIFTKLFDMINCERLQLDNYTVEYYMKNYLGIKCYTQTHYFWIFFIIFPTFCFYGFLLPFSIQIFAYSKKSFFTERKNIIKYDFLMRQYFKSKNSSIWQKFFFNHFVTIF